MALVLHANGAFLSATRWLELAPISVKVQAMNTVQSCSNLSFRRIWIDSKKLKKQIILFIVPGLVYLIVWTALDMPKQTESLTLDHSGNANIVNLDRNCSSASVIWNIISYVWQFLLLLSSSVLSFFSRDVEDQNKEIKFIGLLVYSHLMFLIFRIIVWRLSLNGSIRGTTGSSIESISLSLDVIIGVVIYFGSKFYAIMVENKSNSVYRGGLASAIYQPSDLSGVAQLRKARVSVIKTKSSLKKSIVKSYRSVTSRRSSNFKHSDDGKKVKFKDTAHIKD